MRHRLYNRPMGLLPVYRAADLRRIEASARGATADGARGSGRDRRRADAGGSRRIGPRARGTRQQRRRRLRAWRAGCARRSSTWTSSFAATRRAFPRTRPTRIASSSQTGGRHGAGVPGPMARIADRRRPVRHRSRPPSRRRPTRRWSNAPTRRAFRYSRSTFPADSTPTPASRAAPTIRAAATATFIALKPGLLTGDGLDCCGDVSIHSLDLEPEAAVPAEGHRLDWSRARRGSSGRARAAGAQRAQGNLRHARHRRRRRWHGRRAAPGRTRRAAHGRRQGVDRIGRRQPSRRRLEPARADAAGSGRCRWRRGASAIVCGPGNRHRSRGAGTRGPGDRRGASRSSSTPMRSTPSRRIRRSPRQSRVASAPTHRDTAPGGSRAVAGHDAPLRSRRTVSLPRRRSPPSCNANVVVKGAGSVLAHAGRDLGHQRQRQCRPSPAPAPVTCWRVLRERSSRRASTPRPPCASRFACMARRRTRA